MVVTLSALILIIGILSVWFGLSAIKAKNSLEQAIAVARTMQTDLTSTDGDVSASMDSFADYVDDAYGQTSSPVWTIASITPVYGNDVKAVRAAVEAMHDITTQALPGVKNLMTLLQSGTVSITDGTVTLPNLTDTADSLDTADTAMQNAQQMLQSAPDPPSGTDRRCVETGIVIRGHVG